MKWGEFVIVEEALKYKTAREIAAICARDLLFYEKSGGGVTLSGGEPLYNAAFFPALTVELKRLKLHIAVETAGAVSYSVLENPEIDLFLYDLKCIDSDRHRALTGVSNELILENLQRLIKAGRNVIVRMPMIPGYNMELQLLKHSARF